MVTTQITKESVNPMGFWTFDTKTGKSGFNAIENQRRIYYKEMDIESATQEIIEKEIKEILQQNEHKKKPIIRIKLTGKEKKLPLDEIKSKFDEKAIVSFRKATEEEEIQAKTIEEHKMSVQELGKKLLEENMKEFKLNPKTFEHVFELLLEDKPEEVVNLLSKE
jgi:hypothetical protein